MVSFHPDVTSQQQRRPKATPSLFAGYKVFAVVDASDTYSKMAQEITLARVVQAGVVPIDTAAVCSELQRTWNREDAPQWDEAYSAPSSRRISC